MALASRDLYECEHHCFIVSCCCIFVYMFISFSLVEIMRPPFNNYCPGCRSADEEETVIHFLCKCISLARCRYMLLSSLALVSLTELSSIDVKDIASFIKLLAGFQAWCSRALNVQPLRWPTSFSLTWRNLVSAETVFTCGVITGRYERTSEVLV